MIQKIVTYSLIKYPDKVPQTGLLAFVSAYKALMDSAYGGVKQNVEITEAETPIFKKLDIDVIE